MKVSNISSIVQGIQLASIGKFGSRDLPMDLSERILEDIQNNSVDPVQKTAFLSALFYKGFSDSESKLKKLYSSNCFKNSENLVDYLSPGIPIEISKLLKKIVRGEYLTISQAETMGDYFFDVKSSSINDDCARSIGAVYLRVRYASDSEYAGLYNAFMKTIRFDSDGIHGKEKSKIIQLSEPFDGVNRNYLITPLIANYFAGKGYRVVSIVGDSSGPKHDINLKKLASALNGHFIRSYSEIKESDYGNYLDLGRFSNAWQHWVGLRKKIIKRPFMATLEKFPNIVKADINISSAFHEAFSSKMLYLGENAGYPINIVIRKGREGSLAFSLAKPVEIYCSVLQKDGNYKRNSFEYSLADLNEKPHPDGRHTTNIHINKEKIEKYLTQGSSNNLVFDRRIKLTLSGLQKAFDWASNYRG